jgi:hypothetical protein
MPSTSWSLLQGFMVLSFMAVALQLVMCMSIRLRKGRRVQYQVCSIIAALLLTMAVIFMMLAPNKFIDLCIPDSKNISYSTTFGVRCDIYMRHELSRRVPSRFFADANRVHCGQSLAAR